MPLAAIGKNYAQMLEPMTCTHFNRGGQRGIQCTYNKGVITMTKLTTELTSRLNARVEDRRAEIIQFMRDICAIPSMESQIKDVGERCAQEMRKLGFDEVRFDVMGNILGRIGAGPRHIVFDSHIDTVGIGDRTQWTHDPFQGVERDGILFARGASDEKGSTPGMIYGMALARDLGLLDPTVWTAWYFGNMEEWCDGIAPHALVEHVDHDAFGRRRQGQRESLHQHEGSAQVGLDVPVPACPGGIVPFVAFEGAGVVDQHADRPEHCRRGRQQAARGGFVRQVGRQHDGATAARADRRRGLLRCVRAAVAVHREVESRVGQRQGDGAAEPLRTAGHQGDTRDGGGDGGMRVRHG